MSRWIARRKWMLLVVGLVALLFVAAACGDDDDEDDGDDVAPTATVELAVAPCEGGPGVVSSGTRKGTSLTFQHQNLFRRELLQYIWRMRGEERLCRLPPHTINNLFLCVRGNRNFRFLHGKDHVWFQLGHEGKKG